MPPDFILRREEADVSVQELYRYGTLTILVELGPKRYIRLLNASVFEPFWIQPQIQSVNGKERLCDTDGLCGI